MRLSDGAGGILVNYTQSDQQTLLNEGILMLHLLLMNTEVLVSDSTSPWYCTGTAAMETARYHVGPALSLNQAEAAKLQRSGKERADVVPANTSPLPVLGDSFFPRRPTTIL